MAARADTSHVRHCCAQLAHKEDQVEQLRVQSLEFKSKLREAEEQLANRAPAAEELAGAAMLDRLEASLYRFRPTALHVLMFGETASRIESSWLHKRQQRRAVESSASLMPLLRH